MPYVSSRGVSIYYKDLGQGPPLILVPGLGGDSRAFNPLLPFMRRERVRFVALDPRGLGRSKGGQENFTRQDMVLDVLGLMDHLNIEKAFLLGASLGALVVRSLALNWPQRVQGLILCTPPATAEPAAAHGWTQRLRSLLENTPAQEIMMKFLEAMVSPRYLERNKRVLQDLAMHYQVDEKMRQVMIRQLEIWREEKQVWELPGISCLILGGEEDRLVRVQDLERISRSLPKSRLVILKKVGHHLALEAPLQMAREVVAFIASVAGRAGP